MSRSSIIAHRLTMVEATELWERSDESSAFARSDPLATSTNDVRWWGADRSGGVVAAWSLVRSVDGGDSELRDLIEALGQTYLRFRFSLPKASLASFNSGCVLGLIPGIASQIEAVEVLLIGLQESNGANSPARSLNKHFYVAATEPHFKCAFGQRFAQLCTTESNRK